MAATDVTLVSALGRDSNGAVIDYVAALPAEALVVPPATLGLNALSIPTTGAANSSSVDVTGYSRITAYVHITGGAAGVNLNLAPTSNFTLATVVASATFADGDVKTLVVPGGTVGVGLSLTVGNQAAGAIVVTGYLVCLP